MTNHNWKYNALHVEPLAHNLFAVREEFRGEITRFLPFEKEEDAQAFMLKVKEGRIKVSGKK